MSHSRLLKAVGAAGACAAIGALAGIAGSAAAPGSSAKPYGARSGTATASVPGPPGAVFFRIGVAGPPVHAVQIVPNKAGDGFDTVTQDSGTVKSISGDQLTITEGTGKVTYATPTLTVPAGATVERNFEKAKLGDIQAGDHVDVSATAGGETNVFAVDAKHWPPMPPKFIANGGQIPVPPGGGTVRSAGTAYGFSTP